MQSTMPHIMVCTFFPSQLSLLQILIGNTLVALPMQNLMAFSQKGNPVSEEEEETDDAKDDECRNRSSRSRQLHIQKSIHEKQISVDPMSLNHPPTRVLPPLVKPKFVSTSLPSSTTSSPNLNPSYFPSKGFENWNNSAYLPLGRSKSCGDGRSSQPSDEFDILSKRHYCKIGVQASESNSKLQEEEIYSPQCKQNDEKEIKCGAMCLFLPGFARKKQEQSHLRQQKATREPKPNEKEKEEVYKILSRVASLERFECASWSSTTILDDNEEEGNVSAYFDLPLELIRCSDNDANSPIRTAFVFDREERKGVLKKSTSKSRSRKSYESSANNRHVRFSTSTPVSYPPSPTSPCITPRLIKARAEFNALLDAQNASVNF